MTVGGVVFAPRETGALAFYALTAPSGGSMLHDEEVAAGMRGSTCRPAGHLPPIAPHRET